METAVKTITMELTAGNIGYDQGCPRCLYLSAVAGIKKPSGFFSAAIREMEKNQREIFKTRVSLKFLNSKFPDGKVEKSLGRPKTVSHDVNGVQVTLSGQYDHLVKLASGDYALLMFKTSDPTKNIDALTLQLNALAYILTKTKKSDDIRKVVQLGIVMFDPNAFDRGEASNEFYKYFPVEMNLKSFETELSRLVNSLKGDLPDFSDDCDFCKYQKQIIGL